MEKQQTAVDFLRIAIESKLGMTLTPSYYELFSIAKEMEKKQIIEFADEYNFQFMSGLNKTAEELYNIFNTN